MKEISKRLSKLSYAEHEVRVGIAQQIVESLAKNDEWRDWITGAYLFGSTARGEARKESDLDLAIRTNQALYFGMDFTWITGRLIDSVKKAKQGLMIDTELKINPIIITESWLMNPVDCNLLNIHVVIAVKNEGILLFGEEI